MNSLAYLSRQFDVLASPRTPPSTPTLENAPLLADPDAAAANLKRVQTWSTKSLAGAVLPSGATSYSPWTLKRSYSSPAEVQHGEPSLPLPPPPPQPVASTSSQGMRSSPPTPTRSASRRPSVSSTEKALRPKLRSESLFRRLFFVHVLFGLWHYFCGVWRSIRARFVPLAEHEVAAEDASDDDEKDTEDESKGEKPLGIRAEQPPPIPPPILPAALTTHHPPVVRTNTDSLLDVKLPATDAAPASPIAVARSAEQSRTPTPALGARKMALHLPKTLVLDLDETLIHSTSRPMHSPTAGLLGSFGLGRRNRDSGHTVEVTLGGRSTLYHVYKRPFADYFLRKVRGALRLYLSLVSAAPSSPRSRCRRGTRSLFSRHLCKSMPILSLTGWTLGGVSWGGACFERYVVAPHNCCIRLTRDLIQSCTQLPNGSYTKDLSIIEQDLSRVCLIDNSPICYTINEGVCAARVAAIRIALTAYKKANGIPIEGWTNDPHDEALLDLLPVLDSLRFTSDVRRVLGIRGFS